MKMDGGINVRAAAHAVARRGVLALCALCFAVPYALADSLNVSGRAGFLGEWEITANLTGSGPNGNGEYAGPASMKHVGLCTHGGPEVKTGRMLLSLSASSSLVTATLLLPGVECTYSARKSDGYDGVLSCPDQSPVPLTLKLN